MHVMKLLDIRKLKLQIILKLKLMRIIMESGQAAPGYEGGADQ